MSTRRSVLLRYARLCGAVLTLASPTAALAQAPDANVLRLIVPYPPGGGTDRAARLMAEALQPRLNQTVIVENVTGVGGRLAMRQFATAPADANVLLIANPALMVVAPKVFKNNGYDPDRDYQPVSVVSTYEFAVAVSTAVPVREFRHMLAWLRANPEKASIGVPATGSLPPAAGSAGALPPQGTVAPPQVVAPPGVTAPVELQPLERRPILVPPPPQAAEPQSVAR